MKVNEAFRHFNADWDEFILIFNSFDNYWKNRINTLSSGELRLLETYLILNSKKPIIILDEPFSFISPLYIDNIKTLLLQKKETSILMVTDHF